jgi:hypothetical protein
MLLCGNDVPAKIKVKVNTNAWRHDHARLLQGCPMPIRSSWTVIHRIDVSREKKCAEIWYVVGVLLTNLQTTVTGFEVQWCLAVRKKTKE